MAHISAASGLVRPTAEAEQDIRRYVDQISHSGIQLPVVWDLVTSVVQNAFPRCRTYVQTYEVGTGAHIAHSHLISSQEIALYNGGYGAIDPIAKAAVVLPRGAPFTRGPLTGQGDRKFGSEHTTFRDRFGNFSAGAGIHVYADGWRTWSVHTAAPPGDPDQDEEILRLYGNLSEVLVSLYDQAASQPRVTLAATVGTDLFGFPMFVTGIGRPVQALNTWADALLARDVGVALRDGVLVLGHSDSPATHQIAAGIAGTLGPNREPSYVQFSHQRTKWVAASIPVPFSLRSWAIDPLLGRPSCIICLFRSDARHSVPIKRIADRFSISNAEAKLVSALIAGKSLKAIAEANGVSIHTIRTQLKNATAKMNVRSQPELIGRVMSDPLILFQAALVDAEQNGGPAPRRR